MFLACFAVTSCASASSSAPPEATTGDVVTLPEVTVEGDPATDPAEDADVLADTKVTLAAPFLEVKATRVPREGGSATNLAVRTAEGWLTIDEPLLETWDDDPGCPSIERELAISAIKVEGGALVVVTQADRDETLLTKARACRLDDGAIACSDPEVVDERRYWVDADGELEVE